MLFEKERNKMIKKRVSEFLIICIIGCIWGCKNRENDSVSETKSITLERFDQDLQKFISGNMTDTARFIKEYSDFLPIYCYGILNLIQNNPQDSLYNKTGLNKFFSNSAIKKLYKDTESEFKTTDDIESGLSDAFSRYSLLFPQAYLPRVLTHVSGLNQSIITTDSIISISLDHYLGASYPGYQNIYNPYQLPTKERSRIPVEVMQVLLYTQYPQENENKTLLDEMVYEGFILYTLQQLFPQKDIGGILGYSDNNISWCKKNEHAIWDKIIRQRHLFSTDLLLKNKYLGPAPFTSPISPNSPGRIGRWIGWRIVSEYMKRCNCSLHELLEYPIDGEQILKVSKYKGKG